VCASRSTGTRRVERIGGIDERDARARGAGDGESARAANGCRSSARADDFGYGAEWEAAGVSSIAARPVRSARRRRARGGKAFGELTPELRQFFGRGRHGRGGRKPGSRERRTEDWSPSSRGQVSRKTFLAARRAARFGFHAARVAQSACSKFPAATRSSVSGRPQREFFHDDENFSG